MTTREPTMPKSAVVVLAGSRRRAVVPTLRSVAAAASVGGDELEIVVVVPRDQGDEVVAILAAADLAATVVVEERGDALSTGVASTSAEVVAVLDAGDLVGVSWLAAGIAAARERNELVHPAAVLVFGRHIGWWHQPSSDDRPLLPIATTWASPVIGPRSRVAELAAAARGLPRARVAADPRRPQSSVRGTTAFVRSWDPLPPWEIPAGDLLPPDPLLRETMHAESAPEPRMPRSLPWTADIAVRALRAAARPWISGATNRLRRRRGIAAYPISSVDEWRRANEIEPLVPFPRGEFHARHRPRSAAGTSDEREWADAYHRLVAALPERIDYLYFAPWIRMGGGDAVTAAYINAVRRLDPAASVVLLTTEPVESTQLGWLDPAVTAVELREVVDLGRHRTAMVERVVPQIIGQYRPATIHAFNSTIGFDVIEQFGDTIAESTRLFLSSFAIDRDGDGERLSVMFLRRPGFLDPVSRVLADSHRYVDTMVRDLGYAREKFAIQSHVIDLPFRDRPRGRHGADQPLRVLWAGRFDLPKRLDILAAIAEAVRSEGLPVEIAFYGGEVMGHPGLDEVLRRLEAAGAVRHPPYAGFAALPLERFDAYVMTSEWEGVPHTVLEAMAVGLPVVAPLVGGVGEVLDASTGYPIGRFDDVAAYVAALRDIIADPAATRQRSANARALIERDFSLERFDRTVEEQPGYLRTVD